HLALRRPGEVDLVQSRVRDDTHLLRRRRRDAVREPVVGRAAAEGEVVALRSARLEEAVDVVIRPGARGIRHPEVDVRAVARTRDAQGAARPVDALDFRLRTHLLDAEAVAVVEAARAAAAALGR